MQANPSNQLSNSLFQYLERSNAQRILYLLKNQENAAELRSIVNQPNAQGETLLSCAIAKMPNRRIARNGLRF